MATPHSQPSQLRNLVVAGFMLVVIACRALPYIVNDQNPLKPLLWGMTPVLAMFFFGLSQFSKAWMGYAVPLAALVLSDVVLQYTGMAPMQFRGHLFIYACFLASGSLGWWLRWRPSLCTGFILCWAGPLVFFLLSNFGVWFMAETAVLPHLEYTKDWQGLMQCYLAGLPFLRNDIIGTSLFMAVLFGGWLPIRSWLNVHRTSMAQ